MGSLYGQLDCEQDIHEERIHQFKIIKNIESTINNSYSQTKGDEELKNIRKRSDGRYEWRKQINLQPYQLINKNKKRLETQVRQLLKQVKLNKVKVSKTFSFAELMNKWYNNYKKDIKSGNSYASVIKNYFQIPLFKKNIKLITYEELEQFIINIKAHRIQAYCYYIITGVFKEAYKLDIITKDISQFISKPKNKTVKGQAFKISEQKLILDNLDKTPIKNEILFYILTGCRREEALNTKYENIDFDKHTIFINGTKTKSSKRYVPISKTYAEFLKYNFKSMFKFNKDYYTQEFATFLKSLNIKNHKLHDLRHTFSTNLYYLKVPDKERQSYMGHASIVMTNDIYTTLEPNVTKNDILNLYKDLYPEF